MEKVDGALSPSASQGGHVEGSHGRKGLDPQRAEVHHGRRRIYRGPGGVSVPFVLELDLVNCPLIQPDSSSSSSSSSSSRRFTPSHSLHARPHDAPAVGQHADDHDALGGADGPGRLQLAQELEALAEPVGALVAQGGRPARGVHEVDDGGAEEVVDEDRVRRRVEAVGAAVGAREAGGGGGGGREGAEDEEHELGVLMVVVMMVLLVFGGVGVTVVGVGVDVGVTVVISVAATIALRRRWCLGGDGGKDAQKGRHRDEDRHLVREVELQDGLGRRVARETEAVVPGAEEGAEGVLACDENPDLLRNRKGFKGCREALTLPGERELGQVGRRALKGGVEAGDVDAAPGQRAVAAEDGDGGAVDDVEHPEGADLALRGLEPARRALVEGQHVQPQVDAHAGGHGGEDPAKVVAAQGERAPRQHREALDDPERRAPPAARQREALGELGEGVADHPGVGPRREGGARGDDGAVQERLVRRLVGVPAQEVGRRRVRRELVLAVDVVEEQPRHLVHEALLAAVREDLLRRRDHHHRRGLRRGRRRLWGRWEDRVDRVAGPRVRVVDDGHAVADVGPPEHHAQLLHGRLGFFLCRRRRRRRRRRRGPGALAGVGTAVSEGEDIVGGGGGDKAPIFYFIFIFFICGITSGKILFSPETEVWFY
ncbi:hypothetical protein CTA1_4678 [Colletotrichum tanaceti]|uniref:Uncharacterized protein n=1 Tax=Colletotrichum tanaceti TaxID=1306861 RepID=A0A4V6Y9B3_9PEZI|nr:hypothetical protein CTA1_4678 [Colletotrichum tanaceti]